MSIYVHLCISALCLWLLLLFPPCFFRGEISVRRMTKSSIQRGRSHFGQCQLDAFPTIFPFEKRNLFFPKKKVRPKRSPTFSNPTKKPRLERAIKPGVFSKVPQLVSWIEGPSTQLGWLWGFLFFFFDANKTSTFRKPLIFWGVVSWMCFFCFF